MRSGGSILLRIPSTPASSSAENARYGLANGSGQRNSTRLGLRARALHITALGCEGCGQGDINLADASWHLHHDLGERPILEARAATIRTRLIGVGRPWHPAVI